MINPTIARKIARPYGDALFELTINSSSETLVDVIFDMHDILNQIINEPNLEPFLANPIINNERKKKVLLLSLDKSPNPLTLKFIDFIIEEKRVKYSKQIIEHCLKVYYQSLSIFVVKVSSVISLTTEQKEKLTNVFEQAFSKKIKDTSLKPSVFLECSVDKTIYGGLKIEENLEVLDLSFVSELNKMARTLGVSI